MRVFYSPEVMAWLDGYYQTIPPYYLRDRFAPPAGTSAQRLHFLASRLNLDGTNIAGWKLRIQSHSAPVPKGR